MAANKTAAANGKNKTGAVYVFSGEYYYRQDKGLGIKNYELSVTFPDVLKAPLSVFKSGVSKNGHPVRSLMIKKYPDFASIRTYCISSFTDNTSNSNKKETKDINKMNLAQLTKYIETNGLGIDTNIYGADIKKIREIITLAETDPDKFKETYEKDVKEYEYERELENLNGSEGENVLDDLEGDDAE